LAPRESETGRLGLTASARIVWALVVLSAVLTLVFAGLVARHLTTDARRSSQFYARVFAGLADPSEAGATSALFDIARDIRAQTGLQSYVGAAPVNLVYVADLSRMAMATDEEKAQYSGPDAGFIAQNVYLFCASEGLATVVRGLVNRPALAKLMKLKPDQKVILAQSVGYPAGTT